MGLKGLKIIMIMMPAVELILFFHCTHTYIYGLVLFLALQSSFI